MFTFYTLEGAIALRDALRTFDRGRLVVNMVDMPIKCPVAPLEFCFLADWYLRERGVRDDVEIVYATPLDGAFTKPVASERLGGLLAEQGHRSGDRVRDRPGRRRRRAAGQLGRARDRRSTCWSRIPLHGGAPFVARSPGLGDELGFVPADTRTLQRRAAPNVFAIGDATNLPTSKAGSVTHFEGETLVENIRRFLDGEELERQLRRPRQLLHRDRLPQGAADRLQLRRSSRCPGGIPSPTSGRCRC